MDFRLRIFVSAAHTLNFSQTAAKLDISQPAVSTHIKLLENELGVKLFARQGKGFRLTYSGELLLQKAERILALYDEFRQEASLLSNVTESSFIIGIPRAIYYGMFPDFAADWCRLSPQSSIHHLITDISDTPQSVGKNFDAIMTVSGSNDSNFIFTDYLLSVTPVALKEDRSYDIAQTRHLRYDGDHETSTEIISRISAAGMNPQNLKVAATMKDTVSAIKFLIEYGKGSASSTTPLVSFFWKSQISDLLQNGLLKPVMITEMGETVIARRNYSIYQAEGSENRKGEFARFLAFAKRWAAKKLFF